MGSECLSLILLNLRFNAALGTSPIIREGSEELLPESIVFLLTF